ncbi:MAG: dTDP-glucose 4,6-dehydratase [Proteobacteria bacterium]|nr:dTDP-glucose 4,6-dehydratase [Pseudomonadota bacterium]
MASNWLVTGGAGFIGANFVHALRAARPADRVVVLDALTYAGHRGSLPAEDETGRLRFIHGNICDAALVRSLLRDEAIDTIVHFAAESHVDRSVHDPGAFVQTNVVGTYTLLEAARAQWLAGGAEPAASGAARRFHQVSTDEVYGSLGADDPPFHEATPYAPNSPYAASKAAADHLVRAYHRTYGLPVTISNCSNNYGPYQFPEKLLPLVILHALQGKAIPLYGDGRNVRDWMHVEDHVQGILAVIARGRLGEAYNLGGKSERANLELLAQLCALIDQRFAAEPALAQRFPEAPPARGAACASLIVRVQDRPGHDRRYAIDAGKAARELELRPQWTLERGLAATLDWYLEQEPWWRSVMDASYRDWMQQQYRI